MNRADFGITASGAPVQRITLANDAISLSVLTLGATLQDLRLAGLDRGLTLGSSRLADYEDGGALVYFGCIAGPVANRISGARTVIDGRELELEANGAGGHALHGGAAGLHRKLWAVEAAEDDRLLLSTSAADGEGGLPGERRFEAEFLLGPDAALTLKLRAETDAPSFVNLANHSYWNLSPQPTFHGHLLQIDADSYLPCDGDAMVTGDILPVDGTAFDFREPRALSAADDLDNNFCLSDTRGALRPVARLSCPDGPEMRIETTEPGLQIYDARHMPPGGVPGHDGRRYGPRSGLAIEAQFWPDAPNQAGFPSVRLEPGAPWEQVTRFTFSL